MLVYIPGKKSSAQLRFFRYISPFKNKTEIINISQENLIQSGQYAEVKTRISSLMQPKPYGLGAKNDKITVSSLNNAYSHQDSHDTH